MSRSKIFINRKKEAIVFPDKIYFLEVWKVIIEEIKKSSFRFPLSRKKGDQYISTFYKSLKL